MSLNPYGSALGGRGPVGVIAETPERLAKALGAMSAAEIEAKPAPDKWSVREVVAHLADCEIAFGFRLRQARAGESHMQPFDQDAWAKSYGAYTVTQALQTFTLLRAWNVAFVRGLSEAEKQMPAVHPERGAMVLWTIVETMGGHDRHHLKLLRV